MRIYKLFIHIYTLVIGLIVLNNIGFKTSIIESRYSVNLFDMQWINGFTSISLFQHKTILVIALFTLLTVLLFVIIFSQCKTNKSKQQINEYKSTLQQNQLEIKNIYSFFSDVYIKTDNKGSIIYVSPSLLNLTGYKPSFYLQKNISEIFAFIEEWNDVLEALQKGKSIENKSYSIKTINNNNSICSVTITKIKNSKGKITGYNGVLKDFSERVSTQQKVEDIVSILKSSLKFTDTVITRYRSNRNKFLFDESFSQLLGYEKYKTPQLFELINYKEKESIKEVFSNLLNKNYSSFTILCRLKNADNKYLLFSNKFSIHNVDKSGEVSEIIGIHTLIEKQKELETIILDQQRKLSVVCNSAKAMMIIVQKGLIITDLNNATAIYFDKSKTEIQGENINKLFLGTKFEKLSDKLLKIISNSFNSKTNNSTQEITYTQGENKHYFIVTTNVYIGGFELNCHITIEDITTQKSFEKQTQNKLSAFEKKEQETISLISKISSEIKSPINEILSENPSNLIQKNARKIIDIIENVNNLAILKLDTYSINIERFNVIEYLNNLKETITKNLENNIQLICNPIIAPDLEFIYTDAAKLKSLITSTVFTIANNYNPKSIEIGIDYIDNSHLLFVKTISNNEVINSDSFSMELLNDLASTIDASFIVETIAPNVVVCKFVINDTSYIAKTEPLKIHTSQNIKILIVEDEEYNVFYLSKILEMVGYDIVVAEDGQKAVDTVKQDNTINLVLMDIRLPGIDGIEASKRIKEFNPNLPIIAQTAFNLNSKEDRDMEKYCDDYIQKPIVSKTLYQKIEANIKNKL